jgi:very-short-patch-repair endonuclease
MTNEEFAIKGKDVHGDKFDYSLVDIKNQITKVLIICPIHGKFEQIPKSHLKGHGCSKCSASRKQDNRNQISYFTFTDFVKRAKKVHGNIYEYIDEKTKKISKNSIVNIKCSIHGEFPQLVRNHLNGAGCKKCSHDQLRIGLNKFIEISNQVHNGKYLYILSKYKNSVTPVTIICPLHGPFNQAPSKHMNGANCPTCAAIEQGMKLRLTEEIVLERFYKTHGDRFDYSEFIFNGVDKPSTIICKEHTSFITTPYLHEKGSGCPKCASTKGEREIMKHLDNLGVSYEIEKKFEDCKSIRQLRFDFYIEKHNLLIEFDGEQHFKPVRFGGLSIEDAERDFLKVKKYDKIKNKFAKDCGFKLIRIPSWKFKDIESILTKALQ